MNMRSQFPKTVGELMDEDNRIVTLLGDIGVFNFRFAMQKHPDRVYNIGILEQATISMAAGMALTGMIPVVHTIAPFLVERAYEQLKLDFGYQQLGGNFVGVGASYDYAGLGSTHQCPADVPALKCIPGMEVVVPGTAQELDALLRQCYADGKPTYYRVSETCNSTETDAALGKAVILKKGAKAAVVAVGPMLDRVLKAAKDLDVTVLYYSTVAPFDADTLKENCPSGKVLLCEPYYEGTLAAEIYRTFKEKPVSLSCVGVPHRFLTSYGKLSDTEKEIGLCADAIRQKLEVLIHG
jgi:transketolase